MGAVQLSIHRRRLIIGPPPRLNETRSYQHPLAADLACRRWNADSAAYPPSLSGGLARRVLGVLTSLEARGRVRAAGADPHFGARQNREQAAGNPLPRQGVPPELKLGGLRGREWELDASELLRECPQPLRHLHI
jgi:hypothetical protein